MLPTLILVVAGVCFTIQFIKATTKTEDKEASSTGDGIGLGFLAACMGGTVAALVGGFIFGM
jgi:hypothetical protein